MLKRLLLPVAFVFTAGMAHAQADVRPNILIAISDDQSYPHASAYGCRFVKTPAFDRVAASGALFHNAFTPSPGCSPSRAALLTGRYPWQLQHAGTHASSFPEEYTVYPDLLEKAGYHIGFTGKGWGPGNWRTSGRERNPAGLAYGRRKMESPGGISNNDYAGNFSDFLEDKPDKAPFYFWYGASEPHRVFKKGIGLESGKRLADAEVPPFLPDTTEVRSDLLDYGVEIEWFDRHLGKMLDELERRGELENTLVIVTSDNGMAFPRAKANVYEFGFHAPLAIAWPKKIPGGRELLDLVSLVDVAPTLLEAAGLSFEGAHPMTGKSLLSILTTEEEGRVDATRTAVFSSRERHSSSRYNNWGYPQRALRGDRFLYIRNFHPERWPAGAPRKYDREDELGRTHGGYHDIDACPTLTELIERRDDPEIEKFFHMAVDKRPEEELFDIEVDPGCLNNLAADPAHKTILEKLRNELQTFLRETGDPRVSENPEIWETYPRYSPIRSFPAPEGVESE